MQKFQVKVTSPYSNKYKKLSMNEINTHIYNSSQGMPGEPMFSGITYHYSDNPTTITIKYIIVPYDTDSE